MFGYVLLSKENLTKEDKRTYKSYYCGLCHVLKELYGVKGQKSLSYDMVFLDMLLSDLYDEKLTEGKEKCALHTLKAHDYIYSNATYYAAKMQMLLYYYSLLDNKKDEGKDSEKIEEIKDFISKIEEEYPRQAESVKKQLALIEKYEKNNIKDPNALSSAFGALLGEIFVYKDDDHFAPELRMMGSSLGRFIYLLDAWDDRKKDKKKSQFNPLSDSSTRQEIKNMLLENAALFSQAFERLPLDQYLSILRNIVYSGIWIRFNIGKDINDESV